MFFGDSATAVYQEGNGQGFPPLEPRGGGHWSRAMLPGTLMSPSGSFASPFEISALDVAAIEDMGYPVRMENATPFQIGTAPQYSPKRVAEHVAWCGTR